MKNELLADTILKLVELRREGTWWDFKRQWPSKEDLLHDITCIANNPAFRNGLIVIGVDEENDYSFVSIVQDVNRKTTQNIADYLKDKPYSGDVRPLVSVFSFEACPGIIIDVLEVLSTRDTPYTFSKQIYGLQQGNVYTRVQDTNTPKDRTADRHVVEKLWGHHFGLDATPIERMVSFLDDQGGWRDSLEHSEGRKEFYELYPEYTIEYIDDDARDALEYYHCTQTDSTPHWDEILLRYHQTVIECVLGMSLDGGRYYTPVPKRSFIDTPNHQVMPMESPSLSYCYFVEGSILFKLHLHCYKAEYDDERIARDKFIKSVVVFRSEDERRAIEALISSDVSKFEERVEAYIPRFHVDPYLGRQEQMFRESMAAVRVIQEMLEELRCEPYELKLFVPKSDSETE